MFDYKIVGRNRELFWVFLVMMVYFIGFNVYFPYITVYFTDNLGMDYTLTGVVQGAGLLAASVLTIPAARFIDRGKCGPVIAAAVGCNLLGLLGVSFSTAFVPLLIGVFGAGAGYILVLQALTAWIKNPVSGGPARPVRGCEAAVLCVRAHDRRPGHCHPCYQCFRR